MGILEMDFERILGVPFFHSGSHSIMLCAVKSLNFPQSFMGIFITFLLQIISFLDIFSFLFVKVEFILFTEKNPIIDEIDP